MKLLPISLLFSSIALFAVSCSSPTVTNRYYKTGYGDRAATRNYQTVPDGWSVNQGGRGTGVSFTN
jgi:hypothetical protein